MSSIKCGECRLVNKAEARVCRRCGAPLYPVPKNAGSKSGRSRKLGRMVTIPAIVVVVMLSIYVLNRDSNEVATVENAARGKGVVTESAAATPTFYSPKELCGSFVSQMDRNLNNRDGKGFEKNQNLTAETLALLQEYGNRSTSQEEQPYQEKFKRLLEQYHNQLTKYNSDNAYLASSYERMNADLERIQKDPDLSPEQKTKREKSVRLDYHDKTEEIRITPADISSTEQALRALATNS